MSRLVLWSQATREAANGFLLTVDDNVAVFGVDAKTTARNTDVATVDGKALTGEDARITARNTDATAVDGHPGGGVEALLTIRNTDVATVDGNFAVFGVDAIDTTIYYKDAAAAAALTIYGDLGAFQFFTGDGKLGAIAKDKMNGLI